MHMPIFKGFFSTTRAHKTGPPERDPARVEGPETAPVKMDLEERMAFRRELLFETIRATLHSRFIEAHSYRFRVMRTDKRGHCYVVMLDMPPTFMETPQGEHRELAAMAALITKNAQARYGLIVGGVYWRTDDATTTPAYGAKRSSLNDLASQQQAQPATQLEKYGRATAEELAAFEAAWQKNNAIQIGDRTYSSDLAPLSDYPPEK